MSTIKNISIDQGATHSIDFNHYTDSIGAGNQFPLTGYVARLWVTSKENYNAAFLKYDNTNNLTIDEPNGKVTLGIAPIDTDPLVIIDTQLEGYYHLEIEAPTGEVYRTFKVNFNISKQIIV